ncbi:MAG TPA: hypothetical protein VNT26_21835, partial [Candidatus Sulfotelmatobacter sp.]|nr:hypothetical protein [Candidatus Sulfotelmatobacter sp.]
VQQPATNLVLRADDNAGHSGLSNPINIVPSGAPYFFHQPSGANVFVGAYAYFGADARGTEPLAYQWRKNGAAIAEATAQTFIIYGVRTNDAGNYSVVVTNAFGAVTSTAPAVLTVMSSLGEALNAPDLPWTTGGEAAWFGEPTITADGVAAAKSGDYAQSSWLQTTVTGPGTLSFWWKVSSEPDNDVLIFSIGGHETNRISGEVDWQEQSYALGSGPQTLRWEYSKDWSDDLGMDAGWVDRVSFTPPPAPLLITGLSLSNGVVSVWVPTQNGSNYVLCFKDSLSQTNWQPLPTVLGDGTVKKLLDPAPNAPTRFYRVEQRP